MADTKESSSDRSISPTLRSSSLFVYENNWLASLFGLQSIILRTKISRPIIIRQMKTAIKYQVEPITTIPTKMKPTKNKWIGLAEVHPLLGSNALGSDEKGACVNVIALAYNGDDFNKRVRTALKELKLKLITLEEAELFSDRSSKYRIDNELLNMAKRINDDNVLEFGKFHTYPITPTKNES